MGFTTETRDEASKFLSIGFYLDFIQKFGCDKIHIAWAGEMVQPVKVRLTTNMSEYR